MSVLQALLESRDAAQTAYDDFINPLREAGAELTDEQTEKRTELRTKVDALDSRIDEVDAEEKRTATLNEVRSRVVPAATPNLEVREQTTYGPGAENSYYLDLIHAHNPIDPLFNEARERLVRGSHEVAVEYATTASTEKRQRIAKIVAEEYRSGGKESVRNAMSRMEAMGKTGRSELRAGMDTTSGSGGSFATPVYLIGDYAPYREAGRAFADVTNKQDLPEYGMTVFLPHVTGPAGIGTQVGQNNGVTETDPTAGYLSSNLTTLAGEVTVSQQLLDRTGPGFSFDRMIFDQLNRDYSPKLDQYALTQALAGAGAITYTDASGFTPAARTLPAAGGFFGRVGAAKTAIRTGAGTFMNPTHLFMQPARWDYIEAWADANGRPIVVPNYAGPFNALAGGNENGDAGVEGATGYKMSGLPVYQDFNIPTPGTGADQAIVCNPSEVWLFEGTPVTRVVPQTLVQNLSVILQQYSYTACIVRYPLAVQAISGSGMATIVYT